MEKERLSKPVKARWGGEQGREAKMLEAMRSTQAMVEPNVYSR
jgi:hypothetical protein